MKPLSDALFDLASARETARSLLNVCDDADALRSVLLEHSGDSEITSLILKRIVDLEPQSLDGWLQLAEIRYQLGDNIEAYACVQRARAIAPHDPRVLQFRLRLSYDLTERRTILSEISDLLPDDPSVERKLRETAGLTDLRLPAWPPGQHPPDREMK